MRILLLLRVERPRRWLGGWLVTNINIDNTKGHRVPFPACILKLVLVSYALDMAAASASPISFTATEPPAWSGSQIRSTLNKRLERAILYDYIHNPKVDICAKWRPYVTIGDDIPTIHGLPTPSRGGGKR